MNYILSAILASPIIGLAVTFFIPKDKKNAIRWTALAIAFVCLVLSVIVWANYDFSNNSVQFSEKHLWIGAKSTGVHYFIGVDGLNLPLLLLTTLLCFVAVIVSWNVEDRVKTYFIMFLLLQEGMLGVFVALDLFLFYVFFELVLIPMYFLIGLWGSNRREYAAMKFIVYTLAGSVVMLLGFLVMYFSSDPHTFDMTVLANSYLARDVQILVWLMLFFSFAIKVPIFPFHTWLPDAHTEAPTAISVLLAGVLLKIGGYGFLRVSFSCLPEGTAYFAPFLGVLALLSIVYGSAICLVQKDLKRMIAYSSVAHMGYAMLGAAGLTATGLTGCVMQMVTHGIITGSLFILVGVIYDRTHTRQIGDFGGIGAVVPVFTGIVLFTSLASLGLPGLAGFVSEFNCFVGAFMSTTVYGIKVMTIIATSGLLLGAIYMLWMVERMFYGKLNEKWAGLKEINAREIAALLPLQILILLIGVFPKPVIDMMETAITELSRKF